MKYKSTGKNKVHRSGIEKKVTVKLKFIQKQKNVRTNLKEVYMILTFLYFIKCICNCTQIFYEIVKIKIYI